MFEALRTVFMILLLVALILVACWIVGPGDNDTDMW